MPESILCFAFIQVEAMIVEEEHEGLSCEAVQDEENATCLQQSLAAVSEKDVSTLVISFKQLCLAFSSFSVHYYVQFSHLLWNWVT